MQTGGRTNASTIFRFHARNSPNRTGLVYRDRSYSFFEMDEQIDRVGAGLAAAGIGPGDRVVLMLKNAPEFLFVQAGVGRLGGAAVSVSWRSTAKELTYLVENSGARGLFFDASVAAVVKEAAPQLEKQIGNRLYSVRGEVDGTSSYEQLVNAAGSVECPAERPAERPADRGDEGAVIIYTSGTTGKPKGAVRKQSSDAVMPILGFIDRTPMRVGQTHLLVCPLYHSTAFGFMSISYALGAKVVMLDGFEPEGFLDAIEQHRVNTTAVVPTMLHRVLALGGDAVRSRDTSSLEAIFTGGAPLSGRLAKDVLDTFGDKLFNFYGATETGLVTLGEPRHLREAPGTIGCIIAGNEIRLLDDDGNLCAPGEVGELYVRSGNLVEGYHANEKATRDSMTDGFFSVGDLARVDDRGYYFIEGRKRDMIISGGVNVYPREVEMVLHAHPAVAEAAVIGVVDDEWGERVRAFVALRPGHDLDEAGLLAYCRDELAGPKRPREVVFLDQLPRNPTGKVLKRDLRELG